MGIYSEYLDKKWGANELAAERKRVLARIAELRNRNVLSYAADINKGRIGAPIDLGYDDLLPINDQLENLQGNAIDVILETPGGSGETAEDIVRILREKFDHVAFIVPGTAKSAGTIMVMGADEILMDERSALGPIDAQIQFEGKQFSAEALIKGFEKIRDDAEANKRLERAYIPLLQRISPGDLQHAQNALDFAKILVTDWLSKYKFKNWNVHRSHNPGAPVTDEEKTARAAKIADDLCNHSTWKTHGRSIRLKDLEGIGVEIVDFGKTADLEDAIRRYHVLVQMMFSMSNVYKVIETPTSQILRIVNQGVTPSPVPVAIGPGGIEGIVAEVECGNCKTKHNIQLDFDKLKPLGQGCKRFPKDEVLVCEKCGNQMNLAALRQQVEIQTKRQIIKE